jgi:polar amino acid transport system substrate-binding protein
MRIRDILLCVFMFVFMSNLSFAEKKELVVPISEFSPWKMINGNRFHGIDVDILHKMAERLDIKLRFIKCPFARCLEHMKEGKADFMSSLLKRPEREVFIRYLEPPYYNDRKVFYVLKGKSQILKRYEDLYDIRVGVKRKVKYFPRFDKDTKINKKDVTDVIQNIEKLALGRIDALINSETQGDYLVAISGFKDKFEKAQVIFKGYDPVHFGISKRSKFFSQAADFEKVLAQMIEEGQIDTIKRHFMSQVVVRKPTKKK